MLKFHSFMKSIRALVSYLAIGLLYIQALNAQCYPDRHNTTASNAWLTCAPSQSLNAARGLSHWILYDLGDVKEMGTMHFWNLNHPDLLDNGAKTLAVDYSLDGVIWEEWGSIDLEMATASGFYEGAEVADLDRLRTRMLLLTIIENHGGECYGFGELRVETFQLTNDEDLLEDSNISLSPNPAIDYTRLSLEVDLVGSAQIVLMNALGQDIYNKPLNLSGGDTFIELDLSDIPAGSYYVKVITARNEWMKELSIISN